MKVNTHSIQFNIVALGIALIGVSFLVRLFFVLPYVQEQLRNERAAQQLLMANYMAREIDQDITTRQTLIGQLADSLPPALLHQPAALARWLKERQQLNPLFNSGLMIIPRDGHGTLASYPRVPGRDRLDFTVRKWFEAALTADRPVVGKPQRGRAIGRPIIAMAAPIRNAHHQVVAVMAGVAEINSRGFMDDLHENHLGNTGSYLLISPADKLFVDATDPAMVLKSTPPPGVNRLHDRAMAGYRGAGVTVNAQGGRELSAIASVPSTGWFLVARMPTAEAFRLIRVLRGFMFTFSLLGMVGITAILLLLLPRILRPLTEVSHAIQDMADGKRDLAPLAVRRKNEVSSLILGFNALVARLHEQEAALTANRSRMEFLAHHDALTGLSNRAMLEDRLQQALAHAARDHSNFALLFCDLDHFKPVNDQYGHPVGDAVLCQIAKLLAEGRRQVDTVARLGGDEFVILLPGLENARSDAERLARQYLPLISGLRHVDGQLLGLTASIGIALYQGASVSSSQLLSQADIAMYQAKRTGKNRICFFDAAITARMLADPAPGGIADPDEVLPLDRAENEDRSS